MHAFPGAASGAIHYVAEGQGYGLLLTAQMAPVDTNAKAIFDGITEYVLDHPSTGESRLHAAEQNASFTSTTVLTAPQMAT